MKRSEDWEAIAHGLAESLRNLLLAYEHGKHCDDAKDTCSAALDNYDLLVLHGHDEED